MASYPLPAVLYTSPTSAAVGGTPVIGIADDRIIFDPRRVVRAFGTGLEPDAWEALEVPSESPPALSIDLRDTSAQTRGLLCAALNDVGKLRSDKTGYFGKAAGTALVIRPSQSGALLLYGPSWCAHPENRARIVWHRNEPFFEGSTLVLMPRRKDGKRAWMEGTAAELDSYYGMGEEA